MCINVLMYCNLDIPCIVEDLFLANDGLLFSGFQMQDYLIVGAILTNLGQKNSSIITTQR